MTASTTTLNLGTGGDKVLTDTITTVDSATAPTSAIAQMVKLGGGTAGQFTTIGARADGYLQIQADPSTLLFDTFETLDTTNTWTLGGTVNPTGAAGVLTINAGTAASNTSYAYSKPLFIPGSNAFLQYASIVTLAVAAETGNKRIFGFGTVAVTPTAAVPIANGSIFEIGTDGVLYGAVYSNSVRTQSVALTRPTDGTAHRYAIYYKTSRVYFNIDNVTVGTIAFPNPQVANLPTIIGSFNDTAALGSAATLTATLIGLGDTGRNANQINDGVYQWRKATIKPANSAVLAADTALVVAISPNSTTSVTHPTITKGTQGASGVSTQDLKDAGRTNITLFSVGAASGATGVETAITLTKSAGTAANTSTVSFVITSGKTFRITSISVATRGNVTATIQSTTFNLRLNTAGAVTTTSTPILMAIRSATPATASAWDRFILPIPDGFEISGNGTIQFGITANATFVTNAPTWDVLITGFEY